MSGATFQKLYADTGTCQAAVANYRWLAGLGGPLRLPALAGVSELGLTFEHVSGRHADRSDLVMLAAHLGQAHAVAYRRELFRACLGEPYRLLAGFPQRRTEAVARELRMATGAALGVREAAGLIGGADGPAAFYKDANPRNFLITAAGPVTVDFDQLTLAPFGYDLAKLVVTMAMTYGRLPETTIGRALAAYNAETSRIAVLSWEQFMSWAEIHHILTGRYLADGRYRYSWPQVRPCSPGLCSYGTARPTLTSPGWPTETRRAPA